MKMRPLIHFCWLSGALIFSFMPLHAQDPFGVNIYSNTKEKIPGISSTPLNIINVIPSPAIFTTSLAFDGQYLWVGSYPDQLIKILPADGTVLKVLNTAVNRPYGIACVNGYLWVADDQTNTIHQIDTVTGNTFLSFNSFYQGFDSGLAWDGNNLWHADLDADSLYVFDTTGVLLNTLPISLNWCSGLTFQNNYLWADDNSNHTIYKFDTLTFVAVDTILFHREFPNGIAFDGQYLWVAENENATAYDSIYQIDIGATGIIEMEQQSGVSILPNPSSGNFYFRSDKIVDEIKVYNYQGQLVHEYFPGMREFEFNLSESGIYFMDVISGKERTSTKIIVIEK